MRLAALLAVAVACQAHRAGAPASPSKAPECDLSGDGKLACMAELAAGDDEHAVSVLLRDYSKFGDELFAGLGRAAVTAQRWYELGVRLEIPDPEVAGALYDLAAQVWDRSDLDLGIGIAIGKVHVTRDQAAHDAAAKQLLELTPKTPRLLEYVLGAVHEPTIAAKLCTDPPANLVWQCVKDNPAGLLEYLPAIARLPFLSASDALTLQAVDAGGALPGLRCLQVSTWRSTPDRFTRGAEHRATAASEIVIYDRILDGLAPVVQQCLLEEASVLCVGMINAREDCPLPMVIADYVRAMSPDDQGAVIKTLFDIKGIGYRWFRGGAREEGVVLMHLHVVLADILADVVAGRPARDPWDTTPYHIAHAAELWKRFGDPHVRFADVLSPRARETCHQPDYCKRACTQSPSCEAVCTVTRQNLESGRVCD